MEEILAPGLPVIEDCAQGLGAKLAKQRVGTFGEVAVFSFYATKLITSGEGGMLLSGDPEILMRAKDLRDYDNRDTFVTRFNYKMTDLQAALGRSQLQQLGRFLQQRRTLASLYAEGLASLSCQLPPSPQGRVYYRYVISVEDDVHTLIQSLAAKDIEAARPIYRPLHRYLNQRGYPGAEEAWKTHLSLPIHPSLTAGEVGRVCASLGENS
jgi:dTDP-4-amino-4,6-dideoxygalactose transaminase